MIKHIWQIFMRDVRVNSREFLSLYIIIFPVLFALGINAFTPGINDTTVNLAMLENENTEYVTYLEDFAKVEVFEDVEGIENRVGKRDNIIGIIPNDEGHYILAQGNEPEGVVDMVKTLKSFYELGLKIEDTTAEIISFERTVPPMKKLWVNIGILFTSVLGGMLIALNIVEEKVDGTLRAVNITPVSRISFILGKSMVGLLLPVVGSVAILWITGFGNVNLGQALVMVVAATLLSLLIGFIEGIKNDDVMNAAANIKMLFIPLIAGVAVKELLADKWQVAVYWNPFYWAYLGNDAVLSYNATWQQVLVYTGIVLLICSAVYFYLAPKIRKGLE